jgi:guanylate kinase
MSEQQNQLVIVSGPSGCGKGKVIGKTREVLGSLGLNIVLSVSSTTRPPRENERPGVDYNFLTKEEFLAKKTAGRFSEWSEHNGYFYGSPKVEEVLGLADDRTAAVIWEVEPGGATKLISSNPQRHFTWVGLLPPSRAELERRLRGRATDSQDQIQKRLVRFEEELPVLARRAPGQEIFPNLIIINNDLSRSVVGLTSVCMGWSLHNDPIPKGFISAL